MSSPFFGLDIATRALRTSQQLVDISNQNIANANTPGYSRQTAVKSKRPCRIRFRCSARAAHWANSGYGVKSARSNRVRDALID